MHRRTCRKYKIKGLGVQRIARWSGKQKHCTVTLDAARVVTQPHRGPFLLVCRGTDFSRDTTASERGLQPFEIKR